MTLPPRQPPRRRLGAGLIVLGLGISLLSHWLGSRELRQFGGHRTRLTVPGLAYPVVTYDLEPGGRAMARVVIFPGFSGASQTYLPLARTLSRHGYAVRIVDFSGTPNSPELMHYENHLREAVGAARDWTAHDPGVPLLHVGHSEGTRWALQGAFEGLDVSGVAVLSAIAPIAGPSKPANLLMLLAEDDFGVCQRNLPVLLGTATAIPSPQLDTLYGEFAAGTARRAMIVPDTNHFTIPNNVAAQRRVLAWFARSIGVDIPAQEASVAAPPTALAIMAVAGVGIALVGVGLAWGAAPAETLPPALPVWFVGVLMVGAWIVALVVAGRLRAPMRMPLLAYGRIATGFGVAALPLLATAAAARRRTAGVPRGSWAARALVLAVSATCLLFQAWFAGVVPRGERVWWFLAATGLTGAYVAADELLRRGVQRRTDWQTAFALGLLGALAAALAASAVGYYARPPADAILVGSGGLVFALLVAGEIPATWLYARTGDWLLSWWVRVAVLNGALAAIVPLISEISFRSLAP